MREIKLACGTKIRLSGSDVMRVTVQAEEPDIFFVEDNNSRLTFQIREGSFLEVKKLIDDITGEKKRTPKG